MPIFRFLLASRALRLLLVGCAVAALLDACSKSDDLPAVGHVRLDTSKPVTVAAGETALLLNGPIGLRWSAAITAGEEWLSFSASEMLAAKSGSIDRSGDIPLWIVYYANRTPNERRGRIEFTFEGAEPVLFDLVQEGTSPDERRDVYTGGQWQAWPEIPARAESSAYTYVTHTAQLDGRTARNYTLCYDAAVKGAWWVAYPLHAVHTGSGRVDSWQFDPQIPTADQPDLSKSYGGSYDRGHQLPNADRSANSTMQAQTFYYSNMTPQYYQLNQGPWAKLEGLVRDWICSDTLYVVTGASWKNSRVTTTDGAGNVCLVPTYYYKVVARTVKGNTGRRLADCAAEEIQTIGFWVANQQTSASPGAWVRSVAEIEAEVGFSFFPTLPPAVKQQKNPARWGGLND